MNGSKIIVFMFLVTLLIVSGRSELCAQEGKATLAFKLIEKDLIPEGIIYDKIENAFFIGSIYKQKIVKADKTGNAVDFKAQKEDGLYAVLGMKIDSQRRILWVCSYADDGFGAEKGYAGIFKYDLNTGRLIKKYLMDNKKSKHLFNDIIITSEGDAYFTDSEEGGIYKINNKKDIIEVFIPSAKFSYPNGIALSPDEKYIFIADNTGITRSDLKGNIFTLKTPDGITAGGCDGLYFYKNSLVGVQNGIEPERVVRFYLNDKLDEIEKMSLLCQNNPLVFIPTTGVIVDDDFYVIGNSQLDMLKEGKITDYQKLQEVRIVKIRLE